MKIATCPSSINIQTITQTYWDKNLNSTLSNHFHSKNSIIKINLNSHLNTSMISLTLASIKPTHHSTKHSKPASLIIYKPSLNNKPQLNRLLIMNLQSSYSDSVSNTIKCLQSTMTKRRLLRKRKNRHKTLKSNLNKLNQSKISEKVK